MSELSEEDMLQQYKMGQSPAPSFSAAQQGGSPMSPLPSNVGAEHLGSMAIPYTLYEKSSASDLDSFKGCLSYKLVDKTLRKNL